MRPARSTALAALCAALSLAAGATARASGHGDAPLIKQDPQADITDVYAFVGTRYDDPTRQVLNVIVQVRPFSEPGDGGIFDLLDPRIFDNNGNTSDGRGQDGGGVDGLKGYNVLAYAIQVPLSQITPNQYVASFADLAAPLPAASLSTGVGVYASVSRPRITLRRADGNPVSSGPWIQVSRMGNPLFNALLVALADKDRYNRTAPTGDAAFATYAQNPQVAFLINSLVLGDPTGQSPVVTTGRHDLGALYIPDVLRVDTTTGPVRLAGRPGFSRLGFIGGDTATAADGKVKPSGWPNGRRLGDDVVDIALSAVASGPGYASLLVVGDNVAANDQVYHQVFPYSATPHAGPAHRKDPGP